MKGISAPLTESAFLHGLGQERSLNYAKASENMPLRAIDRAMNVFCDVADTTSGGRHPLSALCQQEMKELKSPKISVSLPPLPGSITAFLNFPPVNSMNVNNRMRKRTALIVTRLMPAVTLMVAMSTLTACGTINRVSIRELSEDGMKSQERGIAIFSVGAKEACTSFATGLYVEDETTGQRVGSVPAIFIDNTFQKSDFSDHHGMVDAITLLPGRYVLKTATVNPMFRTVKTPSAHFEIRAGESTYLGELYMPLSCQMFRGMFTVHDRFDRDLAVIKQNQPRLLERPLVKHIMKLE